MKVKRYIADNYQEALIMIKKEMGSNAIILNQNKIRERGIKGLFKKKRVEVFAALEEKNTNYDELYKRDILEIKMMLKTMDDKNKSNLNKADLTEKLIDRGIDKKLSEILTNNLRNINDINIEILKKRIANFIGLPKKIDINNGSKKIIFIGPTGVGKTTTIAKLASNLILNEKKNVLLVTTDIFKIAGAEQLKIYADILGINMKIMNNIFDLRKSEDEFNMYDAVLIDTSGRSHKDEKKMSEIKTLLKYGEYDEIYLCLSATTRSNDLKKIIETYEFINDYNLIFTKLDETDDYSSILNTIYYSKKHISYVTTGQIVPDDISLANAELITKNILEGFT